MNRRFATLALGLLLAAGGCSTSFDYEEEWMDSPATRDASLTDPAYRVSTRPGLTAADRARPVVIAVHGFTASTYEWEEFRDFAEGESRALVSLVLLGGHGRSIEEFEESSWEEWGRPILEEYEALVAQGYTEISFAGASTGATLLLEQISRGAFKGSVRPRHFFFVDPIVVPGSKALTLVRALRYVVGNSPQEDATEEERRHWYTNRPTETLAELYALTRRVRSELADGFSLPEGSAAKVYKTSGDETADPVSALLIYRGLRTATGGRIDVEMFDSGLHVLTRLRGRAPEDVRDEHRRQQAQVFREMLERVAG